VVSGGWPFAKIALGKRERNPHTLRCDGNSSQGIDFKPDRVAPSRKRVRKRQRIKGLLRRAGVALSEVTLANIPQIGTYCQVNLQVCQGYERH
jgi:hypothetical protein